jgi:hypothetical protein
LTAASSMVKGHDVVMQKHIDWFNLGARTLRVVARERGFEGALPGGQDWYLCPLCLDVALTVEELGVGELTVEHVPPEALGGDEKQASSGASCTSLLARASARRHVRLRSTTSPPASRSTALARQECSL